MTSADEGLRIAWWDYLRSARWFGGKGMAGAVTRIEALHWYTPPGAWPALRSEIATVEYAPGRAEHYHLLAAYRPAGAAEGVATLDVPGLGTVTVVDAATDPDCLRDLTLALLAGPNPAVHWRHPLAVGTDAEIRLFSGEQSNTTVVVGDALLKLFRKLEPGTNLDADVLAALDASEATPRLEARLTGAWPEASSVTDLGIVIERIPDAQDGWELACAACAAETSFATEAATLGLALRDVHEHLATAFGGGVRSGNDLADAMERRLRDAVAQAPALVPYAAALGASFDALRGRQVAVQRVHGDFHLGQTLASPRGWTVIDFEGEPAKTAAERREFDSVWRDVAGMLRSFDYARSAHSDPSGKAAIEWAERATRAFVGGYCGAMDADADLLRAYEVDKAVYEVLYELRNRPDWVSIPLRAVTEKANASPLAPHD